MIPVFLYIREYGKSEERMKRKAGVAVMAAMVALAMIPAVMQAQTEDFGKNKVQYTKFSWSYLQTDHFDVYFAEDGYPLAEFAAFAAESAYVSISKLFRYQIINRVPLIVYNSHNAFQQTNVISEYLDEGIGGVTELFKNRVVVPFEGDYRKFRHVIHHELVHAIMNDMFYGGSVQSIISNNITLQIPLWLSEGLSEYEALKWDTDTDMFIRDATVNQYLPQMQYLYGYFAYRGGQSVFHYIAKKYGEEKIGEIMNRIKSTRSVEQGFKGSIGLNLEELSERWHKELKVEYWPDIAKREDPGDYARRLTDHKKEGGFYNTSPSISPQGDKVAFISNRRDFFDVFVMNAVDGSQVEKIVDGQQTANLEELHLLTPGISWSPDGKRLAIATKAGEQDAILLVDVKEGDMEKLTFDLEGIFSVTWSPTGENLAFIGNTARQSDLYVYNLESKTLKNLTNDIHADEEPAWSPDGKILYFASDRGGPAFYDPLLAHEQRFHDLDLYQIRLADGAIRQLTAWTESDESSPVCSPDGKKLLFVSDHNGINNVYELQLDSAAIRPVTNSISGVYQLSISRDGSKLVFSSLNQSGFDIFLLRSPFERIVKTAALEPTPYRKSLVLQTPAPADTVLAAQAAPPPKDTTALYGQNIQLDFSNYVFTEGKDEILPKDSLISRLPRITGNIDEQGHYRVNKYKLNFTPDIVYGNAGYDTFYGVTGSTIMAFSDLMGDHQIVFATNLLLDLKNSDYALQYYYLPNRIDFGVGGFHSARFVLISDEYGGSLYRFRTYGANVQAQYPFDRFNRMDFGLSWFNISKENLDYSEAPVQTRSMIVPTLSYTHDTSLWGLLSPVAGSRYRFDVMGTPKLGSNGLSFINIGADYRRYIRLGRSYSLALRFAGGGSFGANPQKYIIGGVDNWINHTFEGGYIPLENAEDYIFLQAGLPLRGYNYNAAIGSKYSLFNFEFRYPLLAFLQAGPLPLGVQSLAGVMFFDAGSAWSKEKQYVAFTKDEKGATITRDLLMGMGTGARIYFLGFLVRFDVAWAWNYDTFSPPKYYISLGLDY
jgi:Tol biopolymer transport system component